MNMKENIELNTKRAHAVLLQKGARERSPANSQQRASSTSNEVDTGGEQLREIPKRASTVVA